VVLQENKPASLSPAGFRIRESGDLTDLLENLLDHRGPKRLDVTRCAMSSSKLRVIATECGAVLQNVGNNQVRLTNFTADEAREFLSSMGNGDKVSLLELDLRRVQSKRWHAVTGDMLDLWSHVSYRFPNLHTLRVVQPEVKKRLTANSYSEMVEDTIDNMDRVDQVCLGGVDESSEAWQYLVPNCRLDFYRHLRELTVRVVEMTHTPWLQMLLGFHGLQKLSLERTSPFSERQAQVVENVLRRNAESLEVVDLVIGAPLYNRLPVELVVADPVLHLPVATQKLRGLRVDLGPEWTLKVSPARGTVHLPRSHRVDLEINGRSRKRCRNSAEELVRVFEQTGQSTVFVGHRRRRLL
jgi:hypothetical protein